MGCTKEVNSYSYSYSIEHNGTYTFYFDVDLVTEITRVNYSVNGIKSDDFYVYDDMLFYRGERVKWEDWVTNRLIVNRVEQENCKIAKGKCKDITISLKDISIKGIE